MNFYFPNDSFSLEDLLSGKINQKNLTDSEKYVITFAKDWLNGRNSFIFETSGSTGKPKNIKLTRQQLEYSARTTLDFLFPSSKIKSLLLCINPRFIGGTQVITRAIILNSDLYLVEASSNPLLGLAKKIDLISLVPLQVEKILNENPESLKLIDTILLGGAPLQKRTAERLSHFSTRIFQTYGMTETASNVAMKIISEEEYHFIGDIDSRLDKRDCLALKGSVTNHQWLQTNDIVELNGSRFGWKGRADWVINSGGVKTHPESLEDRIRTEFSSHDFHITSVPDKLLGEKIVLCSKVPILDKLNKRNLLGKFQTPKYELVLEEFPNTPSGKLDRRKLRELATNRLQTDET